VLVDADHPHAVEPASIADQHPLPLGQARAAGGVPRPSSRAATRAMVRWSMTMSSNAHRNPPRGSFARFGVFVVSGRQARAHAPHR
jgi:hypothetical protein